MSSVSNVSKSILILTSSGGNGHIQASQAAAEKHKAKGNTTYTLNMMDVFGKRIGRVFTSWWDGAQAKGDLKTMRFLLKIKWLAEILFTIPIVFKTIYHIKKHKIDQIVDVQALGTKTILRVVRIHNCFSKRKIRVKKILTDLPTAKSKHFYNGIKKLDKKEREIFTLITAQPLLKEGETEQHFWKKHTGLSLKKGQVKYKKFPIRDQFFHPKPLTKVRVHNIEEYDLLKKLYGKRAPRLKYKKQQMYLPIQVNPEDHVTTIMLGSQCSISSTLKYIKNIARAHRNSEDPDTIEGEYKVFVCCGRHRIGDHSLYSRVHEYINSLKSRDRLPDNLKIVPLSFQGGTEMASLFTRSDRTITRSGGLTTMELLSLDEDRDREILIHSESQENESTDPVELIKKMPEWEAGNAKYLMHFRGAELVAPHTIEDFIVTDDD